MKTNEVIEQFDFMALGLFMSGKLDMDKLTINNGKIEIPLDVSGSDFKDADFCNLVYEPVSKEVTVKMIIYACVERINITHIINKINLSCEDSDYYNAVYLSKLSHINERVKQIIASRLKYLDGKFINDKIDKNIYIQSREDNGKMKFWVINNWWELKEPMKFIDIDNTKTLYVAV